MINTENYYLFNNVVNGKQGFGSDFESIQDYQILFNGTELDYLRAGFDINKIPGMLGGFSLIAGVLSYSKENQIKHAVKLNPPAASGSDFVDYAESHLDTLDVPTMCVIRKAIQPVSDHLKGKNGRWLTRKKFYDIQTWLGGLTDLTDIQKSLLKTLSDTWALTVKFKEENAHLQFPPVDVESAVQYENVPVLSPSAVVTIKKAVKTPKPVTKKVVK